MNGQKQQDDKVSISFVELAGRVFSHIVRSLYSIRFLKGARSDAVCRSVRVDPSLISRLPISPQDGNMGAEEGVRGIIKNHGQNLTRPLYLGKTGDGGLYARTTAPATTVNTRIPSRGCVAQKKTAAGWWNR